MLVCGFTHGMRACESSGEGPLFQVRACKKIGVGVFVGAFGVELGFRV